jgi:hypothetical protein
MEASHCLGKGDSRGHHQAAIGETVMAGKNIAAVQVRGQNGRKLPPLENHQRVIQESIGMILHVTAVEEKRSVARAANELVPFLLSIPRIAFDDERTSIRGYRLNKSWQARGHLGSEIKNWRLERRRFNRTWLTRHMGALPQWFTLPPRHPK